MLITHHFCEGAGAYLGQRQSHQPRRGSTEQLNSPIEESAEIANAALNSHPWGPVIVNRPARLERRRLKVVAFNACGGRSLEKISERLRRPPLSYPDIVLLSEMDWRMRRSGRRETAADLAADLGMSFAYIGELGVPRNGANPSSFIGSAMLSNWPLSEVRVLPFQKTLPPRLLRLVGTSAGLAAKITVNRRRLALGVAHLNRRWNPGERALQLGHFLDGFPSAIPGILGGDFNTTTIQLSSATSFIKAMALTLMRPARFRYPQQWEPLFERLREAGFDTRGANVSGAATFTPYRLVPTVLRPKLDWLAVRGLKPVAGSAAVIAARTSAFGPRFSDHDFIMCEVEVCELG